MACSAPTHTALPLADSRCASYSLCPGPSSFAPSLAASISGTLIWISAIVPFAIVTFTSTSA